MMSRLFSCLLLILLISIVLVQKTAAECILNQELVLASKQANDDYALVLGDRVHTNEIVYRVCNGKHLQPYYCQSNGNFMPALDACEPPKAVVTATNQMGPLADSIIYSVGYKLPQVYLELYRTAYSRSQVRAYYTLHAGRTGNTVTHRPNVTFTTDGLLSGADAQSFKTSVIHRRFQELYGLAQPYVSDDTTSVIQRGHLAPSADFYAQPHMRASFKYVNVVPQFATINRGNWRQIEAWVRKVKNSEAHAAYRVVTGGLDVLKLPNDKGKYVPAYLLEGDRNPVPKWVFKLVQKETSADCTLFLTSNNIFEEASPAGVCLTERCPGDIKLTASKEQGQTYCCNVRDFKRRYLANIEVC